MAVAHLFDVWLIWAPLYWLDALVRCATAAVAVAAAVALAPAADPIVAFTDYGNFDALGLAELVRQRQVTPAELVDAAIARAQRVNPRLGAIVAPAGRRRAPRRRPSPTYARRWPVFPFLLKDLYGEVAGAPATGGSRYLAGHEAVTTRRSWPGSARPG